MPATESMVWSEEEAKYLKALLSFNSATNGTKQAEPKAAIREKEKQIPPAGEFKILIVGAKGCGKTSILEKLPREEVEKQHDNAGAEHPPQPPPPPTRPLQRVAYKEELEELEPERQHRITLDGLPYTARTVEFRSRHLSSDPHLLRALDNTDAAAVVYDVTSRPSLRIAQGIVELVRDSVGLGLHPADDGYGLVLVGNKADCTAAVRQVSWGEGAAIAKGRFRYLRDKRARLSKGTAEAEGGDGGEETAEATPPPFLFVETSATQAIKSPAGPDTGDGDNIERILPHLCREVLRIRLLKQQRWAAFMREAAEKEAEEAAKKANAQAPERLPVWKMVLCPWRIFTNPRPANTVPEEDGPYL